MSSRATTTFLDEAEANAAAAHLMQSTLVVTDTRSEIVEEPPPAPYTTASLLEDATTRLNWRAEKVMAVAQSLFEGIELGGTEHRSGAHTGLITYHRTDSIRVAPEALVEARSVIARLYGQAALPARPAQYKADLAESGQPEDARPSGVVKRLWARLRRHPEADGASPSRTQEAHEATRPTLAARLPDSLRPNLDDDQLALYRLIWERFIASQMRSARYRVVTVELEEEG